MPFKFKNSFTTENNQFYKVGKYWIYTNIAALGLGLSLTTTLHPVLASEDGSSPTTQVASNEDNSNSPQSTSTSDNTKSDTNLNTSYDDTQKAIKYSNDSATSANNDFKTIKSELASEDLQNKYRVQIPNQLNQLNNDISLVKDSQAGLNNSINSYQNDINSSIDDKPNAIRSITQNGVLKGTTLDDYNTLLKEYNNDEIQHKISVYSAAASVNNSQYVLKNYTDQLNSKIGSGSTDLATAKLYYAAALDDYNRFISSYNQESGATLPTINKSILSDLSIKEYPSGNPIENNIQIDLPIAPLININQAATISVTVPTPEGNKTINVSGMVGSDVTVKSPSITGFSSTSQPLTIKISKDDINKPISYNATYTANKESANINFVDKTTNKILKTDNTIGDFGTTDKYNPQSIINEYIKQGYLLNNSNFPTTGIVYNKDGVVQEFNITFTHGSNKSTDNKSVTETIHYQTQSGNKLHDDTINTITFTRTANKDSVTGKTSYTDWIGSGDHFDSVTPLEIPGYSTISKPIGTISITSESPNKEYTFVYSRNSHSSSSGNTSNIDISNNQADNNKPSQITKPNGNNNVDIIADNGKHESKPNTNKSENNDSKNIIPTTDKNNDISNIRNNNKQSEIQNNFKNLDKTKQNLLIQKEDINDVFTNKTTNSNDKSNIQKVTTPTIPQLGENNDQNILQLIGLSITFLLGLIGINIKNRKHSR
ncbi:mucin-binding protein [Companilactobacillus insicii]|uniref:mucin-binding protein n=1 Tax=Companilactobacillus insicii TaxID=1732567 RepID=UPI000F776CF4|nr:hypothetical protein [Companilactobacillus insicii]